MKKASITANNNCGDNIQTINPRDESILFCHLKVLESMNISHIRDDYKKFGIHSKGK